MNTGRKRRTAKFGELDKLINAEIEVLLAPGYETDERVLDEAEHSRSHDPDERVVYPHPFAERRTRPDEHPTEDLTGRQAAEIVDVKLQQKPGDGSLFSSEEDNFIASTSTWLRGHDNADVVLDEIWRLVIGFDSENLEDESEPDVVDEVEEVPEIHATDPVAHTNDEPSAPAVSETKPKVARRKPVRRKKPKDNKS